MTWLCKACVSHFSTTVSKTREFTAIFYGPAKTESKLATYIKCKSCILKLDIFVAYSCIIIQRCDIHLHLNIRHSDAAKKFHSVSRVCHAERKCCNHHRDLRSPARCSDFIRFVLWLSGGICTKILTVCWGGFSVGPKRDFTGKDHKILSENIPATISQSTGAGQVYSSDMKSCRWTNLPSTHSHTHTHTHTDAHIHTRTHAALEKNSGIWKSGLLDWKTYKLNAL